MNIIPSPSGSGATMAPDPASMQALDAAAGLERMMGDETMYLRVLARFRSDYADTVARLRGAHAAGDATLAHRIAHTLKGAAAMIEARDLRALAADVEQQLRAGDPAEPQLVDRMEAELARVMAQIERLTAPPTGETALIGGTLEAALGVALEADIAHLCALLDLGDSSAQDFMIEKRAGLRTRLGAARVAELESAVAAFDYERALCVLGA